jgi:phosphoribosyl 1,2-cyclic phosphodiesterase
LVATERTRLLVDAGLSRKETFERLAAAGVASETLTAILITHEHCDHVAGLQVIARKLDIPIYMSRLTAPAIFGKDTPWAEDYTPKLELFAAGSSFQVGDIEVTSFTIPHDAADPVGFSFRAEGIKISIATDLGYMPDSIRFHLRGSDVLLLESNHDVEMLKVGPYPWSIKQRIMGRNGHLSNDVACSFIRDELDMRTSTLILGHLSAQNNHPEIVRLMAAQALDGRSLFTRLVIAEPKRSLDQPAESFVY